jgi:dTDP-4-amino-4,6-dideoxygalactose transaminase
MEKLALLGGTPVRPTNLPYARQTIDAADIAAVAESLQGDWITQGPNVVALEQALAAVTGAAHAVLGGGPRGP